MQTAKPLGVKALTHSNRSGPFLLSSWPLGGGGLLFCSYSTAVQRSPTYALTARMTTATGTVGPLLMVPFQRKTPQKP